MSGFFSGFRVQGSCGAGSRESDGRVALRVSKVPTPSALHQTLRPPAFS